MAIRKSSSSGIPFGNTANRPANPQIGQPYFNGEESRLELYTSATGWQNIVQETPAVVSITGQLNETSSSTIQINGTNFAAGATAYVVGTNGIETAANTTTLVSVVEITAVFPGLSPAYAPYDVKVVNPSNLYGVLYETLGVNDAPVWSTGSGTLGTFTELQSVSVTVAATDTSDSTNSPLSYSVVSGALPGGLTLNSSTGVISGTASNVIPNTTYSFTIAATDGRNTAVTRAFSITINDRGPSWSTGTTLPTFTRNVAYSTTVVATDDDSVSSYVIQSGSLPTGLSLSTSGVISGTPTSSSTASFTIRVTDAGGNFADRAFTMPNAGPVWSTAATLPNAENGVAYSTTLLATDDSGIAPTYSLISGSLQTGLSFNTSTGVISGTPSGAGLGTVNNFTIRATDANGTTADRAFTLAFNGVITLSGTGSWTPPVTSSSYKILMVAGGGGGGGAVSGDAAAGGGGGAGGMLYYENQTLTAGSPISYSIGGGGSGGSGSDGGYQGGNTTFGSYTTAVGGGGGGAYLRGASVTGRGNGGSGGGTGGNYLNNGGTAGTGTSGQGSNGGLGSTSGENGWSGGGGGGKSGAGATGPSGGNGGSASSNNISGSSLFYAGGGSAGRSGSGGLGGSSTVQNVGTHGGEGGAGASGFGGGGGGAKSNSANPAVGGNGGSGTIIIRL